MAFLIIKYYIICTLFKLRTIGKFAVLSIVMVSVNMSHRHAMLWPAFLDTYLIITEHIRRNYNNGMTALQSFVKPL